MDFADARLTVAVPNDLQMERNLTGGVEDMDLRVTRQEGPGYSYGHCQKPGGKLEDSGPKMGLRPGYGLRPVVTIMVELVV